MGIYQDIKSSIARIRTAISGLDVRDSIADAIEGINEKTEEVNNGWKALLNAWLEVRDNPNLSFTEVVEARTDINNVTHASVKARLDNMENNIEKEDEDKSFTTTHTYTKNSKTTSINGEGIVSGSNKITTEGAVLNKLTVDSLEVKNNDTGWIMLADNIASGVTNSSSWPSRLRKIGNLIFFDFRFTGVTAENTVIATIPEAYRPSRIMYFWGTMGASGGYPVRFSINTDGTVTVLGTKAFTTSYASNSLFCLSGNYVVSD